MKKHHSASTESAKEKIKARALQLLSSPDCFGMFLEAMERSEVVGEERNAEVLFIVGISRLLPKPINLIIKGPSSAGKNHLASRVLRLFPEDAVHELTSSSALAWNYAGDDFRHRIVYLQERNDSSGAIHPARLLISEGRLLRKVTVTSGNTRTTKTFVAEGPIASVSTTTKNQLEIDDETRHISIWVDASRRQNRRVACATVREVLPLSSGELKVWHEAQRLIEARAKVPVKLPDWFDYVANKVYVGDIRIRRYFPAFTAACKAVALLRSFQKSTDELHELSVEFADFWVTSILFESVFVESIHRGADRTLETRSIVERISKRKGSAVHVTDLMKELSISKDAGYTLLREAEAAGAIRRVNRTVKGNKKLFLAVPRPRFIPDPEEMFDQIPEVGSTVKFIHPLTGEWVVKNR